MAGLLGPVAIFLIVSVAVGIFLQTLDPEAKAIDLQGILFPKSESNYAGCNCGGAY